MSGIAVNRHLTQYGSMTCLTQIFPMNYPFVVRRDETFDGQLVLVDLSDTERVPLDRDIVDFFQAKVLPHNADARINPDKRDARDGQIGLVGDEINFNRYVYKYQPPRPLAEIDAELKVVEQEIAELLAFREGDLLIHAMDGFAGAIGVSDTP